MEKYVTFTVCMLILGNLMLLSGCIEQTGVQDTTTTIKKTTTTENQVTDKCIDKASIEEKDDCYLEGAYLTFEETICENIQESSKKSRCYRGVAYRMNDVSICDNIDDEGWKGTCYSQVAKDLKTCKSITDPKSKGICISKFAEDLSDCEDISEDSIWRDDCSSRVALLRRDKNICEMISDAVIKSMCNENLK